MLFLIREGYSFPEDARRCHVPTAIAEGLVATEIMGDEKRMDIQLHHFLPQSYLNAWRGGDSKLTRYVRGFHGKINAKRYAPVSVARVANLYSIPAENLDIKHNVEKLFMQRIDSDLIEPLSHLTLGSIPSDPAIRLKWAKFVSSLFFRMPEVVEGLDEQFKIHWMDAAKHFVAENTGLGLTVEDVVQQYQTEDPTAPEYWAKILFVYYVEYSPEIVDILGLQWSVVKLLDAGEPLMSSDCPLMVVRSENFTIRALALAISPNMMFIAYREDADFNGLYGTGVYADDLIERYNGHIVARARDIVIAYDDGDKAEVERLMSTMRT